jgi:hypothetical protein
MTSPNCGVADEDLHGTTEFSKSQQPLGVYHVQLRHLRRNGRSDCESESLEVAYVT